MTNSGAGIFVNTITGLSIAQVYYILAYAKNDAGISYGNTIVYQHGIITSTTGKTWLIVNLGATAIPTSQTDTAGYGFLYQWGRGSDGHQYVRPSPSGTTSTRSSGDVPNNGGLFITGPVNTGFDWRTTPNEGLWVGLNGVNNPCPSGFRLPTVSEFQAEVTNWTSNSRGPFGSLFLTFTGQRKSDGSLEKQGTNGYYWTSPGTAGTTNFLLLNTNGTNNNAGNNDARASGKAVRCIREY